MPINWLKNILYPGGTDTPTTTSSSAGSTRVGGIPQGPSRGPAPPQDPNPSLGTPSWLAPETPFGGGSPFSDMFSDNVVFDPGSGQLIPLNEEGALEVIMTQNPGISREEAILMVRRNAGLEPPAGAGAGLGLEQRQLEHQMAIDWENLALQREQLAQQRELENLRREQQQREMAAQVGREASRLAAQTWAQGLAQELPAGTQFAPGTAPGGPAGQIARMGGAQPQPQRVEPSPPPSPEEMSDWVDAAISRFGP